jgi:hypothetical protein
MTPLHYSWIIKGFNSRVPRNSSKLLLPAETLRQLLFWRLQGRQLLEFGFTHPSTAEYHPTSKKKIWHTTHHCLTIFTMQNYVPLWLFLLLNKKVAFLIGTLPVFSSKLELKIFKSLHEKPATDCKRKGNSTSGCSAFADVHDQWFPTKRFRLRFHQQKNLMLNIKSEERFQVLFRLCM